MRKNKLWVTALVMMPVIMLFFTGCGNNDEKDPYSIIKGREEVKFGDVADIKGKIVYRQRRIQQGQLKPPGGVTLYYALELDTPVNAGPKDTVGEPELLNVNVMQIENPKNIDLSVFEGRTVKVRGIIKEGVAFVNYTRSVIIADLVMASK